MYLSRRPGLEDVLDEALDRSRKPAWILPLEMSSSAALSSKPGKKLVVKRVNS